MVEEYMEESWRTFEEMEKVLSHSIDLELLPRGERELVMMGLGPLKRLLHRCSLDQPSMPVIQIVGSKGKGSTSTMLEALLRAQGLKTGLYQSPHLLDRRERILVNGEWVSDQLWLEWGWALWTDSQKAWEPLSRFELETAVAYAIFQTLDVDVIIVEAGLGGVDDATSAIPAQLHILTSVELEHTDILGPTLSDIARAKAGVARAGVPFLCGTLPLEAMQVVERLAQERGVRLYEVDQLADIQHTHYHSEGVEFAFEWKPSHWKLSQPHTVSLPLYGSHHPLQSCLAILAAQICCLELLQRTFDEQALKALEVIKTPARLQHLQNNPPLLLDCAHTLDSVRVALEALRRHFEQGPSCILLALNDDKDLPGILEELAKHTESLIILPNPGVRSWEPLTLHAQVRQIKDVNVVFLQDVATGLERLKALCHPDKLGLITGSMKLAGAVLSLESYSSCEGPEPVL